MGMGSSLLIYYISPNKTNKRFIISFTISIFLIIVFISFLKVVLKMGQQDIWYFIYGLNFTSILFLIIHIRINWKNIKEAIKKKNGVLIVLGIMIASSSFYTITSFNIYKTNPANLNRLLMVLNNSAYTNINKVLPKNKQLSVKALVNDPKKRDFLLEIDRPLLDLRESIEINLEIYGSNKNDVLLFIPKEIFELDLNSINEDKWWAGMSIYAITGIPLVHGVETVANRYGYSDYDESSLRISKDEFDSESIFMEHDANAIFVLEGLEPCVLSVIERTNN